MSHQDSLFFSSSQPANKSESGNKQLYFYMILEVAAHNGTEKKNVNRQKR